MEFPVKPGRFSVRDGVHFYLLLTQFVLEIQSTPTPAELSAGDMNGNGQFDVGDLVIHSRSVMGQI